MRVRIKKFPASLLRLLLYTPFRQFGVFEVPFEVPLGLPLGRLKLRPSLVLLLFARKKGELVFYGL